MMIMKLWLVFLRSPVMELFKGQESFHSVI